MNFMVFVRASQGRPASDFQAWYLGTFAPSLAERHPEMGRHVVNLTEPGPEELRLPHDSRDPNDRYDVVAQLACPPAGFHAVLETMRADLATRADVLHAYRVSDTVVLDKEPAADKALPGFKLLRELLFHEDLSDAAAKRCWAHHAKLALKVHVGMTRYVQHWIEERLSPDSPPVRGISELYFPTREELVQRYYESPRGREEIVHDTAHFIERRLPRVYSREHLLKS
jgi:hypothetical protein